MAEVVISIEHLSKTYKIFDRPADRVKEALNPFRKRYSTDFYALSDITLEVQKGEIIGIVGRNGAGKSTLLKLITGVLTPSGGKLDVQGSIASLLELGAGFNPEMTGVENVYMTGTVMGRSRGEMEALLPEILAFADIGDFARQPVKMYSSGMFARLAFAANVFVRPEILIVDEALSVGDMRFQIKSMKKMKELMQGGTAVLFVSHDMNAVRRFCTRAIWLKDGKVALDGDVNWVVDRYLDDIREQEREFADSELEEIDRTAEVEIKAESAAKEAEKKEGPHVAFESDAVEVTAFELLDGAGRALTGDAYPYDKPLAVRVTYDVKDESIEDAVLGISLRTVDDTYICGLNTLLDHKRIPWAKGRNVVTLTYPEGLRVLGGKYDFDVAIFEETATVPLQYISRVKMLVVMADYVGEGMLVIPHRWT